MNIELIKEKIAWYKLLFTVLVTVSAGTVGWFVANYSKTLKFFLVIDSILVTSFLNFLASLNESLMPPKSIISSQIFP